MKQMFYVTCMDDQKQYGFLTTTAYEAMLCMKYYLNIGGKCDTPINKTESSLHLWLEHNGVTYAVKNR